MAITNSTYMQLPIPGVGTEAGPNYAFDVNSCLTLIDQHDHSPGKGIQITPAGININTDLPFGNNSATGLLNAVFNTQSVATSTLQALSVAPGSEGPPLQDLWYTDSAGNKVQITSGGQLAAVATTVQGISYALGTFSFRQTPDSLPTTPANLDGGSVNIRPNVAATPFGVNLAPNSSIASQYTLTLPLPVGATAFVTQDSSGLLAGSIPTAGGIQQSNLASNSVGTSQLINASVTTPKLANGAVTPAKLTQSFVSNTFGPTNVPNVATAWYAVSLGNSIVLGAGQWRLSGSVNWIGNTNFFNDTRFGYFGANGNNNATTPTALSVLGVQSGRIGEIKCMQIQGTNMFNCYASTPDTIITLSGTTTVFLNMYHGSFTGNGFFYQGTISAQQLG